MAFPGFPERKVQEDSPMKIKALMIPDPISITEKTSIKEAIEVMKVNSIRHLPVTGEGNTLAGFVTLADLRTGLIPSMVAGLTLSDLMIKNPIVVDPDSDIEIAAQLIYKHKISGIPVVKKGRLVGIITESDMLRAFIDMMGILHASSRIDVSIGSEPGMLRKAVQIIEENGGEIMNVGMTPYQKTRKKVYSFRLNPFDTGLLRDALEEEGFKVVAAMD
jgi:acetoin utilization protein AcuB